MQQSVYVTVPFIPSESPAQCVCPNCKNPIVTRTEKQSGLLTWLLVIGLFLIGCWFGCCLIPLCIDSFKVRHPLYIIHIGFFVC